MDNECHANICVFVQNSPDPPPPLFITLKTSFIEVYKSEKSEFDVKMLSEYAPPNNSSPPTFISSFILGNIIRMLSRSKKMAYFVIET